MSNLKKILVFTATYNVIRNINELILEINRHNSNVDIFYPTDNALTNFSWVKLNNNKN